MVQRGSRLWRDSSVVRALVRITRGPGFDRQLHCLNFSSLRPSVSAFFLSTGVLVWFNGHWQLFLTSHHNIFRWSYKIFKYIVEVNVSSTQAAAHTPSWKDWLRGSWCLGLAACHHLNAVGWHFNFFMEERDRHNKVLGEDLLDESHVKVHIFSLWVFI